MLCFRTSPSSLCLLLFLLASSSASEDDTVVVTSSGPIRGKRLPAGSGSVTAYLGIPYAEPPIGKLRFQKPVPHQPWSQVLEATTFGNSCLQFNNDSFPDRAIWTPNTPLSEDCLFLNIWVPHPRPVTAVPILLWIYGGGFSMNTASADVLNGGLLAATENVIVASMNYRGGMLGYLYLPPAAPGNVALWDQHLALKWVSENAAVFGGDPARLTLLGLGSGAVSVGFHLLSPASQPLVARGVLHSGVPGAHRVWRSPENAERESAMLSQFMGCPKTNHSAMVSCLQGKEIESKALSELCGIRSITMDGEFLTDEPRKLLESGIQGKPILTGVTANEDSFLAYLMLPSAEVNDGILTWEQLLEGVMETLKTEDVARAVALKYAEYFHGPERYRLALIQYLGDYPFLCPMIEFAAKARNVGSPVYAYYFSHRSSGFPWPEWIGTPHGAEIPYLFGNLAASLRTNPSETEVELSRRVMRYWAEFARSGNPTGSAPNEEQWPVYNATEQNIFHITTEAAQHKWMPPAPRCAFLATHLANEIEARKSEEGCISPVQEKDVKNEARDGENHASGTV
ncbi:cholinesterase-like [Lacerta agilis]|uniref:cholinesterase-like n=1 Tax=Lacerta agilis TaxID=80427 RepID=UPI001419A946|nr:cholinesterase-like [Lacerta agilis]